MVRGDTNHGGGTQTTAERIVIDCINGICYSWQGTRGVREGWKRTRSKAK